MLFSFIATPFIGAFGKGIWQTTNDLLRIGGPSSDDVKITATTGSGSADPTLRVNKTTKVWEIGNNGVSFIPVADTTNSVQITGNQTIAGQKTFNDVTTFKASSGSVSAGDYSSSGAWTFGPTTGSAINHDFRSGSDTTLRVASLSGGTTTERVDILAGATASSQAQYRAIAGADTGSTNLMEFVSTGTNGSSALASRPPFAWRNGPDQVGQIGVGGGWTFGQTGGGSSQTHTFQSQATTTVAINSAATASTDMVLDFYPKNTGGFALIRSRVGTDSGGGAAMQFQSTATDGSTALTARNPFTFRHGATFIGGANSNNEWEFGASSGKAYGTARLMRVNANIMLGGGIGFTTRNTPPGGGGTCNAAGCISNETGFATGSSQCIAAWTSASVPSSCSTNLVSGKCLCAVVE